MAPQGEPQVQFKLVLVGGVSEAPLDWRVREVCSHPGCGDAPACLLYQHKTHQVHCVGHGRPGEVRGAYLRDGYHIQAQCAIIMSDVTSGVTRMHLTGIEIWCQMFAPAAQGGGTASDPDMFVDQWVVLVEMK
ncbi:hypothetical protein STEG23_033778, partial [Scotinomys teguina]